MGCCSSPGLNYGLVGNLGNDRVIVWRIPSEDNISDVVSEVKKFMPSFSVSYHTSDELAYFIKDDSPDVYRLRFPDEWLCYKFSSCSVPCVLGSFIFQTFLRAF